MNKYEAVCDFQFKESQIKEFFCPADKGLVEDIARNLDIGLVEFIEYESEQTEKRGIPEQHLIYYEDGKGYDDYEIVIGDKRVIGGKFYFRAYPKKGVKWSAEDEKAARAFLNTLFIIKSRTRLHEKLDYCTFHDMQTGNHNLAYGISFINDKIERGIISQYASFFINIRNMTDINKCFGNEAATQIMYLYAAEFEKVIGKNECFWRLGGDNYCALILKENVEKFISLINEKYIAYGDRDRDNVKMSASAGIYMLDGFITRYNQVLDGAQSALAYARYAARVPYIFFDQKSAKLMEENRSMELHFNEYINAGEFVPYYQPKIDLKTGKIDGGEALCRWIRNGEVVPPIRFIPVFERSNLICELDFEILRRVCSDISNWVAAGNEAVPMSVNFSRKHLSNPAIADDIARVLDSKGLDHKLVVIEFTETESVADQKRLAQVISRLNELGFKTSVDDFGVGYSSMTLIQDIHFDELKIDKSFVDYIGGEDERKKVMLKHVIAFAGELGMECIAEGVENPEQIAVLKGYGCNRAQGFYFAKPLPKEEFEKKLYGEPFVIE